MQVIATQHPDVLLLEPQGIRRRARLLFRELQPRRLSPEIGLGAEFVQDNHSRSAKGVLRGLHYQVSQPQGKLVRVVAGEVFDVAVDLRRSSPHFGRVATFQLSAETHDMLWIPPGFAHGFQVLSEHAEFLYKTTDYYAPEHERCLLWNDPALGIDWPLDGAPLLSVKDQAGRPLAECEVFA